MNFKFTKKNILIIALSFSGGLCLLALAFIQKKMAAPVSAESLNLSLPLSLSQVPFFDAKAAHPYSRTLDKGGNLFLFLSHLMLCIFVFAVPGVKALVKKSYSTIKYLIFEFIVYAESILYTAGVYVILKTVAGRMRPYMYFENPEAEALLNGDFCRSWPSGHSSMAFVAAGFVACWLITGIESKKLKICAAVLTFAMAVSTLVIRVLSGNHFPSDVISGALTGSTVTFIVCLLNQFLQPAQEE